MRPELVGNPVRQILHSGVISATVDVVGGLAIALASINRKVEETPARHFPDIGTIDVRIDYLRPGPATDIRWGIRVKGIGPPASLSKETARS